MKQPSASIRTLSHAGEDTETGISLTPTLSKGEGAIYNVSGQRLDKMQKGINIVSGKKIIRK